MWPWRGGSLPDEYGGAVMLGIEDKFVWLAYLLCILSTLLCVVYGALNWNRGDEQVKGEDVQWAAEENRVEKEL